MIPNTDPTTNIRYGYVAANDLDGDVVQELMYGSQAKNLSEIAAVEEETARQRSEWEDECEAKSVAAQEEGTDCVLDDFEPDLENFESMIDEPIVEGVLEGVTYRSSWLGGALNFFISHSPFVASTASRASPCVPNAGILHPPYERDGDVTSYDVPPGWWFIDPAEPRNFADQFNTEFE